jgi:hypothetical protein
MINFLKKNLLFDTVLAKAKPEAIQNFIGKYLKNVFLRF